LKLAQVLTIMFTDIKGFTERTSASSRDDLLKLLKAHENLLLPIVEQFDGTLIKTIGDALLVTFRSPTNAVLCGLMMQQKLFEYNQNKGAEDWIQIRIAINSGEVELRQGDVYGEAVNITARIEGITEANEIYFTEAVYLAMNKAEVPSSEVGSRVLKGIPEEIKVFRVIQDRESEDFKILLKKLNAMCNVSVGEKEQTEKIAAKDIPRPKIKAAWWIIAAVIGLLISAAVFFFFRDPVQQSYEQIEQAIIAGELDLARSKAEIFLKSHPTQQQAVSAMKAVIHAQAVDVINRGHYQKAIEQLDKDASLFKLNVEDLIRSLYLRWAQETMGKVHWSQSRNIYNQIFQRFPKDPVALKAMIHDLGKVKKGWEERLLVSVAIALSEQQTDLSDNEQIHALMYGLDEQPDHRIAIESRSIFIHHAQAGTTRIREKLKQSSQFPRINAYLILKDRNQLTDDDLFRYHTTNLFGIKNSKYARESVSWVITNSTSPDWQRWKSDIGHLNIANSPILKRANNAYLKTAHSAIIAGFKPEVIEILVSRANSDGTTSQLNEDFRIGAYEILEKAGEIERINLFTFHTETLIRYQPQYRMRYFDRALEYLQAQWEHDQNKDIIDALKKGIEYTSSWIKQKEAFGVKNLEISNSNLRDLEHLLKRLSP
jgi:class 3 adenylate cyclase